MLMMLRVGQNVIGWKGVAAPLPSKGERKWHLKQHESHRQWTKWTAFLTIGFTSDLCIF